MEIFSLVLCSSAALCGPGFLATEGHREGIENHGAGAWFMESYIKDHLYPAALLACLTMLLISPGFSVGQVSLVILRR